MRWTMAQGDLGRHADAGQELALEAAEIDRIGRAPAMELEIDERRRGVFHRGEALVEVARREQTAKQILRHRFAAAVVDRVPPQGLRRRHPMLEELGRELDEVLAYRRAGLPGIAHAAQEAMEAVAEFVKERARLVESQQRRLGPGEVVVVDDDRRDLAVERLLVAIAAHPGARMLADAGEIVVEEKADVTALGVPYLIGADIGMIELRDPDARRS